MREYKAAIYVRVSKEDGNVESNSITNQKELIKEFLKNKEEISICSEKIDDGYSGANFNRPGFKEMLEEIKEGKIDCIIVKDLSRFGRNYIEAGRYLEKIFPFLGVRFIAINDNYDSDHSNESIADILIPFKNLINDAYCKDISIKIKSQLDIKRRKGEFVGAFPTYGYKKSNKSKNKLIIDEYAAEVVKDIFRWKIQGLSLKKIADRLNLYGILSPMEYKNYKGFHYKTSFKENAKAKWSSMAVLRILKNDIYIGNLIQGKEANLNYRTKKKQRISEENWIRVVDVHKPIVSAEIFNITKKLMKMDIRKTKSDTGFYSGLLRCRQCSQIMTRKDATYKCKDNSVKEEQLKEAIFTLFYTFLQLTDLSPTSKINSEKMKRYLKEKRQELQEYEIRKQELQKDRTGDLISEEEYFEINEGYEKRIKEAKEGLKLLEKGKQNMGMEVEELGRGIIVFFIDSILVYEDNRMELVLN